MHDLATLNRWSDSYRLQYVCTNITEAARNWYLFQRFVNWTNLITNFRLAFAREVRSTDKWRALSSRTQLSGEHITDYFYDKLRMYNDLHLAFEETRDLLMEGVCNLICTFLKLIRLAIIWCKIFYFSYMKRCGFV